MSEEEKTSACCEKMSRQYGRTSILLLLLILVIPIVHYRGYQDLLPVVFWTLFVVLPLGLLFVRHNVIGSRLFFYLDDERRLHVHKCNWWLSSPKISRHNVVLELWFGGWFRKSRVRDSRDSQLWKRVVIHYGWRNLPSKISLYDRYGNDISTTLVTHNDCWAIGQITVLLLAIEHHFFVESILIGAQTEKDIAPIAGKVGTA